MKPTFLISALLLAGMAAARAGDVKQGKALHAPLNNLADAKAAFQDFVEYHRASSPVMMDLFLPDCAVTYTYVAGAQTKTVHIPMIRYAAMIDAANKAKKGTHDQFENPNFAVSGVHVIVTTTVVAADSRRLDALKLVYARDQTGQMSIKEMDVTVPVDQLPR
jgi:hypothetical protein